MILDYLNKCEDREVMRLKRNESLIGDFSRIKFVFVLYLRL